MYRLNSISVLKLSGRIYLLTRLSLVLPEMAKLMTFFVHQHRLNALVYIVITSTDCLYGPFSEDTRLRALPILYGTSFYIY